jgi:hypothetical protein
VSEPEPHDLPIDEERPESDTGQPSEGIPDDGLEN